MGDPNFPISKKTMTSEQILRDASMVLGLWILSTGGYIPWQQYHHGVPLTSNGGVKDLSWDAVLTHG